MHFFFQQGKSKYQSTAILPQIQNKIVDFWDYFRAGKTKQKNFKHRPISLEGIWRRHYSRPIELLPIGRVSAKRRRPFVSNKKKTFSRLKNIAKRGKKAGFIYPSTLNYKKQRKNKVLGHRKAKAWVPNRLGLRLPRIKLLKRLLTSRLRPQVVSARIN